MCSSIAVPYSPSGTVRHDAVPCGTVRHNAALLAHIYMQSRFNSTECAFRVILILSKWNLFRTTSTRAVPTADIKALRKYTRYYFGDEFLLDGIIEFISFCCTVQLYCVN